MSKTIELPAGVVLEPGERVLVWSEASGHGSGRVATIVLGLILSIVIIGLVLIYKSITYEQWRVYTELVTDRRFIQIYGDGRVVSVPFTRISKITTVKQGAVVKHVRIECPDAPPMYVTITSVGTPGASIALADFLARRSDPAFLASVPSFGRAAKLYAA